MCEVVCTNGAPMLAAVVAAPGLASCLVTGGTFWSLDYQIYDVLGLDEMNDILVNQVHVGCGNEQLSLQLHFSMCLQLHLCLTMPVSHFVMYRKKTLLPLIR